MGFTSIIFLFFVIPFFLCIYNFFPFKFKNFIILLFSFFILVWGAPRLFIYFVVISIVNYFAGYFILKIENKIFKLIFTSFVMLFDIAGGHFIHNRNYCYSYFLKDFLLDGLYEKNDIEENIYEIQKSNNKNEINEEINLSDIEPIKYKSILYILRILRENTHKELINQIISNFNLFIAILSSF